VSKKLIFWKSVLYIHTMMFVLVMSWEQGISSAAVVQAIQMTSNGTNAPIIPQASIRLRILANSDAPRDQLLKLHVRDAVVEQVNRWAVGMASLETARVTIRGELPKIQEMVLALVRDAGFDYSVKVELDRVPFPTKVYGDRVYPAGEYEALRITLGRGAGQNWWCVLFPPLCFVGIAVEKAPTEAVEPAEAKLSEANGDAQTLDADKSGATWNVEYRFFLVDWIQDVVQKVERWWA
jgi:stage II sporulation protein R